VDKPSLFIMAAHSNGQAIIFCIVNIVVVVIFFFSPIISGRRLDVRPTQAVQIFGNISKALGTWAIY